MLFTSKIEPNTLSVLKKLMQMPEIEDFSLAGDAALALKFGHRIAVDLDFFNNSKPDFDFITQSLEEEFEPDFTNEKLQINFAVFCTIQNVKVNFIFYPHPPIAEIEIIDGIRIYSSNDIAAMKINTILGRAQKKDFFDLAELLKHSSLDEIIKWHKQKYPNQQLLISIPNAITNFEDAEQSPDPHSLSGQTWSDVKNFLQNKVREF